MKENLIHIIEETLWKMYIILELYYVIYNENDKIVETEMFVSSIHGKILLKHILMYFLMIIIDAIKNKYEDLTNRWKEVDLVLDLRMN